MSDQPKRRSSDDLIREAKQSLAPDPQAAPARRAPEPTSEPLDEADPLIPSTDTTESWRDPYEASTASTERDRDIAADSAGRTEPPPDPPQRVASPPAPPTPQRTSERRGREQLLVTVPVQTMDNRIVAAIVPFLIGLGIATFFALSAGGIGAALIIGVFLVASLSRLFRRLAASRRAPAAGTPREITVTTDRIVMSSDSPVGRNDTARSLDTLREWEIGRGRMPSIELEFDDGTDISFLLTSGNATALVQALRTVAPDLED